MTNGQMREQVSDSGFAAFLAEKTRSRIGSSTIGSDWSGLQAMVVEQGDDAFVSPALGSHFLGLCIDGYALADIRFGSLVGPRRGVVEPGALCFMPAGDVAELSLAGSFSGLHVLLNPTVLESVIAERCKGDPKRAQLLGFQGRRNDLMSETARKVHALSKRPYGATALEADRLSFELANRIVDFACALPSARGRPPDVTTLQLSQAIDYIDANMACDFGLAEIAAHVGAEPTRLASAFEDETGTSIDVFRTERRLSRAQEMLALSDDPATCEEAAKHVGFGSVAGLDAAFRSRVGISLENYRSRRLG
ncbi:MAG: AraC family transcriptional regulator [Pseudomonadota bacterium]